MKKLVTLAMVIALTLSATTVFGAETTSIYRMTKVEDYKETIGQFIVLGEQGKEVGFEDLKAEDYKVLEGEIDYVEVRTGVDIKTFGVDLEKVDFGEKEIKIDMNEGTYLVNYDLEPGTYKLIGEGSAIRLSNVKNYTDNNIIEGVIVEGENEIIVEKEDFALKLVGVRAIKVN